MKFIALSFCFLGAFAAQAAELQLKQISESGEFSKKVSAKIQSFPPLENFLMDDAAACFRGDVEGLKAIVHRMAGDYNVREGGISSFTIDSQTRNGELTLVKIKFQMKSGALWTWDSISKCR